MVEHFWVDKRRLYPYPIQNPWEPVGATYTGTRSYVENPTATLNNHRATVDECVQERERGSTPRSAKEDTHV